MKYYVLYYFPLLAVLSVATAVHLAILNKQAERGAQSVTAAALDIPAHISHYRQIGLDSDVGANVRRVLETSTILIRNYASPMGVVNLTIVHAGATRRSLHFPEVCLIGAGWEVREQDKVPVGILFWAKRLVLVNGEHRQAVLYWFKTGDHLTGNYFLNAYYWARNQLTFGAPTSSMIKLTTPIGSAGEEAAFALLEDFATRFTPILLDRVS